MKSHVLLPLVTAAAGFAIAWIAKPAPTTTAPVTESAAPTSSGRTTSPTATHSDPRDSKRPVEVKAGDFPLADQAAKGPKTREEAKMMRLTEALGLTTEQEGKIISLVQEVQANASPDSPVLTDLVKRGTALEEGLRAALSPEQFAKFQEIRARERDNRIEVRAHQQLDFAIQGIDLSPEQREEVLARLRQKSKEDMQSIPAAATLFFDKSILPTGGKELPVEGVLLLSKAGEPAANENPVQVHQKIVTEQRAEFERMLQCFDGLLTPAQMSQYAASVTEQRQLAEKLAAERRIERERTNEIPQPPSSGIQQAPEGYEENVDVK